MCAVLAEIAMASSDGG